MDADIAKFWESVAKYWNSIYAGVSKGDPAQRARCLEVVNGFLSDELFKRIEIEMTYGEVNRMVLPNSKTAAALIELYISPRMLIDNVPLMEKIYDQRIKLDNLNVVKYRSFNINSDLATEVEQEYYPVLTEEEKAIIEEKNKADASSAAPLATTLANTASPAATASATASPTDTTDPIIFITKYEDLGCQTFKGYNEQKQPIMNIVMHVKKSIADKFLVKKKVTFIHPKDNHGNPSREEVLEKWLPDKLSVMDIFLTNAIGEYNLIHNVGYIEFMPEGDPLIAPGSVFTELSDLRQEILAIEKMKNTTCCATCGKRAIQCNLLRCSKCRKLYYCSVLCQSENFPIHKKFCVSYAMD